MPRRGSRQAAPPAPAGRSLPGAGEHPGGGLAFAACHAPCCPPDASAIRRIVRAVVAGAPPTHPRPACAWPGLAVRWLLAPLGGVAQYVLMASAQDPGARGLHCAGVRFAGRGPPTPKTHSGPRPAPLPPRLSIPPCATAPRSRGAGAVVALRAGSARLTRRALRSKVPGLRPWPVPWKAGSAPARVAPGPPGGRALSRRLLRAPPADGFATLRLMRTLFPPPAGSRRGGRGKKGWNGRRIGGGAR